MDQDLRSVARYFTGRALDVGGGRRRGAFERPPTARWVVADLGLAGRPHVAADIVALPFGDGVFDAVKASEVLEHVAAVPRALAECRRVLRPGGHLVITVPFLERLHPDPEDYARYTERMWERLLGEAGLRPLAITPQGGFFTHLAGLVRYLVLHAPPGVRHLGYGLFPALDLVAKLDGVPRIRRSEFASFVGGYLIVAAR
jgi:SAM-dependent methyltransferase